MTKSNILTRSKKLKSQELLQDGNLIEAKELCVSVVRADKLDADAWVMLAVINRRLGLHQESEASAREALALRPRMATAHTALGAALQCRGNLPEALACYKNAVKSDLQYCEAHYLLGNALRELGQLDEAVASYRRACQIQPDAVAFLSNLGATLMAQGESEEALKHFNHALSLAPDSPQVLCNVGTLLMREGRFDEARAMLLRAMGLNPDFVDAITALAELEEKMSRLAASKALTARGLQLAPDNVLLVMTAAKIARTEGRHQEAIDLLERVMTLNPEATVSAEVYLSLGKLYDRVGATDRAFINFTEGNRLAAEMFLPAGYDRGVYPRKVERMAAYFTDALGGAWEGSADELKDGSPIFLMGFPRSGTTLLDQILDGHPRLQTLSEPPTIQVVQEAFLELVKDRPDALTTLSPDEVVTLRNVYYDAAAKFARLDPKKLLIDKMPLNTAVAHLIWRLFPNAKFILAVRHPCDVCLSCFMQNFVLNEAMITFQYMPDTVALYVRVMGLWRDYIRKLPINHYRVRYEDLVADLEGEARRLIGFIGVEWHDAILNYAEHAKTRVINTPSYHQVTQPIYQHAKYRWKRYARQMEPYLPALAPFIDYFEYAESED